VETEKLRTLTILQAEDDVGDVFLFQRAFALEQMSTPLQTVREGEEALAYLTGNGPFADRREHPLPSLVFLDLNRPKKSGFEVLTWIRQQPQFSPLPVVIYTSSIAPADKETAQGPPLVFIADLQTRRLPVCTSIISKTWSGWRQAFTRATRASTKERGRIASTRHFRR